jgi:regulator of RNase E activity RraA
MPFQTSDPTGVAQRFARLYTSVVADILDGLGYRTQALPSTITALAPGMTLAGPAFVCEGQPRTSSPPEDSMRRMLHWLQSVPPHSVAVYKSNDDDNDAAYFGDLSATTLLSRNCAGVVVDGGCRDTRNVLGTGMPVFCRYRSPKDCVPRWELLEWGHEVVVGDVRVATGDYMLADEDGVIVIPSKVQDKVLVEGEAMVSTEDEIREAVKQGMQPLEAYDRYGIF